MGSANPSCAAARVENRRRRRSRGRRRSNKGGEVADHKGCQSGSIHGRVVLSGGLFPAVGAWVGEEQRSR